MGEEFKKINKHHFSNSVIFEFDRFDIQMTPGFWEIGIQAVQDDT